MANNLDLNLKPSKPYLAENTGMVRVYRYPNCSDANVGWGMEAHTDSSVLSILNQDDEVSGLQVLKDDQWLTVKPISNTLIVNLGDMMQAISDDRYKSVTHRVSINKHKERISICYFVFPGEDVVIESSKYKPFTYNEFRAQVQQDIKALGYKLANPSADLALSGVGLFAFLIQEIGSELNRLNFQGFYTVLLERNEELISVTAVRVYGKKVTEVPPVGTRLEYRPHGMCHILMKKLEKKLTQLGVEGLILPAVPSVLETWTRSFGIAKMTNLERSQFLDYTFLDFQSAIMCQKLLPSNQSPDPVLLMESRAKCDVSSRSCCANFSKNDHQVIGAIDPVTIVEQPSLGDQQCQNGTTSSECSIDKKVDRNNDLYKCVYT
ncbi:Gibberellin 2-beta-dioxygenase 8 [Glycine soja]|uniref:Gibberellin 2-beta-dioxygenase 8 n=1 Tax=Glycine soja TaxID=3848 RepID=A0A0B2P344_GLYSO|nr:Gibberellin 2-beta-dioxygenase 8 [Glycine soja]